MRSPGANDRGAIVTGWLTKVVVGLTVLGVLSFDAISIGVTRFQAEDHARQAARIAAQTYRTGQNLQQAYDAALASVASQGDAIDTVSFAVDPTGAVTLRLRRKVPTLLIKRVPQLRDWTTVTSTVTGRPGG